MSLAIKTLSSERQHVVSIWENRSNDVRLRHLKAAAFEGHSTIYVTVSVLSRSSFDSHQQIKLTICRSLRIRASRNLGLEMSDASDVKSVPPTDTEPLDRQVERLFYPTPVVMPLSTKAGCAPCTVSVSFFELAILLADSQMAAWR